MMIWVFKGIERIFEKLYIKGKFCLFFWSGKQERGAGDWIGLDWILWPRAWIFGNVEFGWIWSSEVIRQFFLCQSVSSHFVWVYKIFHIANHCIVYD